MGYDMYMKGFPSEGDDYFRANIWGMGMLRGAMDQAEILDWDTRIPDFIEVEDLEKDEPGKVIFNPEGFDDDDDDDDAQSKWQELNEWVFSFRSNDVTRVPGKKFCSNDGWHITSEECFLIAEGLTRLLDSGVDITYDKFDFQQRGLVKASLNDDDKSFVKEFAEYCRNAGSNGGFTVH